MASKKWPKYKTAAGEEVPSVTTIIGRFKNADPLIYWANKAGREGKTVAEARDPAAVAGTIAHDLVEWDIKGQKTSYPTWPDAGPDTVIKGEAAFSAYKKWAAMTKLEIRHTEVALVSERHRFGGRLDAIGVVGDQLVLCDWKSSNGIYVDYTLQLAAYGGLWHEAYPDHPLEGGYFLCRFAKEDGDFAMHSFPKLDRELSAFLKMRELYDIMKDCEKRVR